MTMKKRIMPIIVAVMMVFTIIPVMAGTAYADEIEVDVDGFKCKLDLEQKTAVICGRGIGLNLEDGALRIPETVTYSDETYSDETYSVTTVEENAFQYNSELLSVTFPASLKTIGNSAFSECTGLETVSFADNNKLTTIGDRAFYRCYKLKAVSFGENCRLTLIDGAAFSRCGSLTSIDIPSSVNEIGQQAFFNTGLTSIVLPDGLASIAGQLFDGCSSLTEVTIPSSVTYIGDFAFSGCGALTIYFGGSPSQWAAITKEIGMPDIEPICKEDPPSDWPPAEDGGSSPAISIGAGNIEKGNKVYMGVWPNDDNLSPVSWAVLGTANSTDLNNGATSVDAENARLLITEKIQAGVKFDPNGENNVWQGSNIQRWCTDTFLNDADWNGERYQDHFTGLEKGAMLYTCKTDAEYNEWGVSSLDNEKVFLLSAEEVSDSYGYFHGNDSRIACWYDREDTWDWWLRSPNRNNSVSAARVTPYGYLDGRSVGYFEFGARPAFNINLKSVLFTSAAEGGKSSGGVSANSLTAVSANTTNEWKLTLHDSSRDGFNAAPGLNAVLTQNEGYTSWRVPVVYSGASDKNDNDYVSVILADCNDKALYYGNIAQKTASTSIAGQKVTIPEGLTAGKYKLYVFSEQVNGDKLSDYASDFRTINLRVNSSGDDTIKDNPLKIKGKTTTIKYKTLKKKSQTLKASQVIKTVKKGQGELSYKYVSAKKGSKNFKKYFTINMKTGKVTVKRGLKKGTYKVTVKVKAVGNDNYKASAWKTVTFKVRIK